MFSHASLVLCGLLLYSVEISNKVKKGALHNAGMGEVFGTPYTHRTTPITARLYLVNFTSKALLWLTINTLCNTGYTYCAVSALMLVPNKIF